MSRRRFILRLSLSVVLAFVIAGTLHGLLKRMDGSDGRPAGLGKGMVHGALMPLALPSLLVGDDVQIYAPVNTGRAYKLGYITGVNACGLVCFSYFFWRGRRLRRHLRQVR